MLRFLLKKYAPIRTFFYFRKSAYGAYDNEIVAFDFMFFCQKYAPYALFALQVFFLYIVLVFS